MDGLNRSNRIGKMVMTAVVTACAALCGVLSGEVSVTPKPAAEIKMAAVIKIGRAHV